MNNKLNWKTNPANRQLPLGVFPDTIIETLFDDGSGSIDKAENWDWLDPCLIQYRILDDEEIKQVETMKNTKIKYIREADGNKRKDGTPSLGRPIGAIVSINGKIGISLHNHEDVFDKRTSKCYAVTRALGLEKPVKIPNRKITDAYTGKKVFLPAFIEAIVENWNKKGKN